MPFGDIPEHTNDHYALEVHKLRPANKCLAPPEHRDELLRQASDEEQRLDAALGQLSIVMQEQEDSTAPFMRAVDLVHQCLHQTQTELFEAGVTVRAVRGAGSAICKAEMRWLLVGLLRTQAMTMAVHRLTTLIDHALVQGKQVVRFQLECRGTPRDATPEGDELALFDYIRGLAQVIGVRYDVRSTATGTQHCILMDPLAA